MPRIYGGQGENLRRDLFCVKFRQNLSRETTNTTVLILLSPYHIVFV